MSLKDLSVKKKQTVMYFGGVKPPDMLRFDVVRQVAPLASVKEDRSLDVGMGQHLFLPYFGESPSINQLF